MVPADAVTTDRGPAGRSAMSMIAFSAPRILNEPVTWVISSFSQTPHGPRRDSQAEGTSGVRAMNGCRRAAAFSNFVRSQSSAPGVTL